MHDVLRRVVTTNGATRLSAGLMEKLMNGLELAQMVETQMREDGEL